MTIPKRASWTCFVYTRSKAGGFAYWRSVSHITVTSLRSKWAVGKAVRAGLALEGAYLNRYENDEQRSPRPIFNATLRDAAGWLFFRVARSVRIDPDMGASLAP